MVKRLRQHPRRLSAATPPARGVAASCCRTSPAACPPPPTPTPRLACPPPPSATPTAAIGLLRDGSGSEPQAADGRRRLPLPACLQVAESIRSAALAAGQDPHAQAPGAWAPGGGGAVAAAAAIARCASLGGGSSCGDLRAAGRLGSAGDLGVEVAAPGAGAQAGSPGDSRISKDDGCEGPEEAGGGARPGPKTAPGGGSGKEAG